MKSKKVLISVGIGLLVVIIIIYLIIKEKASNGTNSGNSSILTGNAFQTLLTGAGTSWKNLFNANVTTGAYNITLPSYISSNPISSPITNAPTLDLQYMPKGCTIDNYLAGNC